MKHLNLLRFMDPSLTQEASEAAKKKGLLYVLLRLMIAILLPISFFFMVPFLVGFVLVMVADLSITNPISLPSQCKIVSTSVDIRSSKICEIGLLNFKSNHVFHPFERSKYRCRYDYYWTSVFKVEYIEQFSGQTLVSYAEAPNEALPHYCRPTFGAAWLTQYKFKVNETYNCWYTSGISKVRLYQDDFFNCQADEPSALERIREYCTLTLEMVNSWLSSKGRARYWKWETIAGVVTGFSTSLISLTFLRFLQQLLSSLHRLCGTWMFPRPINIVLIRRVCLFLAYFSLVAWLTIQYGKRLGLMDIFRVPKSWHLVL